MNLAEINFRDPLTQSILVSLLWILVKDLYYALKAKKKDFELIQVVLITSILSFYLMYLSFTMMLATVNGVLKIILTSIIANVDAYISFIPVLIDLLTIPITKRLLKSANPRVEHSAMVKYTVYAVAFMGISMVMQILIMFIFMAYSLVYDKFGLQPTIPPLK